MASPLLRTTSILLRKPFFRKNSTILSASVAFCSTSSTVLFNTVRSQILESGLNVRLDILFPKDLNLIGLIQDHVGLGVDAGENESNPTPTAFLMDLFQHMQTAGV